MKYTVKEVTLPQLPTALGKLQSKNMKKIKKVKNFAAEFETIRELGKGSFGNVVLARHKLTNIVAAVKIISKQKMRASEQTANLLK
jgi:serine/threonine protein kinase